MLHLYLINKSTAFILQTNGCGSDAGHRASAGHKCDVICGSDVKRVLVAFPHISICCIFIINKKFQILNFWYICLYFYAMQYAYFEYFCLFLNIYWEYLNSSKSLRIPKLHITVRTRKLQNRNTTLSILKFIGCCYKADCGIKRRLLFSRFKLRPKIRVSGRWFEF